MTALTLSRKHIDMANILALADQDNTQVECWSLYMTGHIKTRFNNL